MKPYQKKFQAEYMSTDHKPKGRARRAIEGSHRMQTKRQIREELELDEPIPQEWWLDEWLFCHCDTCKGYYHEDVHFPDEGLTE